MDTVVVGYQQTVLGLPIWQASLVRMYGDPPQVASSDSTLHYDVEVEAPPSHQLGRYADEVSLREALDVDDAASEALRINDTRCLVYRYDPDERLTRLRPLAIGVMPREEFRRCRSLLSRRPSSLGGTTSSVRSSSASAPGLG